jgi:hypothetical protein
VKKNNLLCLLTKCISFWPFCNALEIRWKNIFFSRFSWLPAVPKQVCFFILLGLKSSQLLARSSSNFVFMLLQRSHHLLKPGGGVLFSFHSTPPKGKSVQIQLSLYSSTLQPLLTCLFLYPLPKLSVVGEVGFVLINSLHVFLRTRRSSKQVKIKSIPFGHLATLLGRGSPSGRGTVVPNQGAAATKQISTNKKAALGLNRVSKTLSCCSFYFFFFTPFSFLISEAFHPPFFLSFLRSFLPSFLPSFAACEVRKREGTGGGGGDNKFSKSDATTRARGGRRRS